MSDYLLIGNKQIYEIYKDKDGKAPFAYSTYIKRHVPVLKAAGIITDFIMIGKSKKKPNCAWESEIKRFYRIHAQNKYIKKALLKGKIIEDESTEGENKGEI